MSVVSSLTSLSTGVASQLPVESQFFTLLRVVGKLKVAPATLTETKTARLNSSARTVRLGQDGTATLALTQREGHGMMTDVYEPLAQYVFVSDVDSANGRPVADMLDDQAMAAMTEIQRDVEAGFWTGADLDAVAFSTLGTVLGTSGASGGNAGWLSPIAKGSQTSTLKGIAQTSKPNWQHQSELSASTFAINRLNTLMADVRREGSGVAFSAISDACYGKLVAAMPSTMAYTKISSGADDLGTELEMFGGAPLYRPSNSWLGTTSLDAASSSHKLSFVSFGRDSFHLAMRQDRFFDKGKAFNIHPLTRQPGEGYFLLADGVFKIDRLSGIGAVWDAET